MIPHTTPPSSKGLPSSMSAVLGWIALLTLVPLPIVVWAAATILARAAW